MDIWSLLKEIIVCVFVVKFGAALKEVPQVFKPDPSLPKELNDFLLQVQNHKNDFRCIRQIANKGFHFRNSPSRSLSHSLGNQHKNIRFLKELYDRHPSNDIYPYMFRKDSELMAQKEKNKFNGNALDEANLKNANNANRYRRQLDDNSKHTINVQPNSIKGEIKLTAEKYPERFVNYKRESNNLFNIDTTTNTIITKGAGLERENEEKEYGKIQNIYHILKENKFKKRDLVIDVKNDGKLIKEIHEDSKDPKSIILSFNPVNDAAAVVPNTNSIDSIVSTINSDYASPIKSEDKTLNDGESRPLVNAVQNYPENSEMSKDKFVIGSKFAQFPNGDEAYPSDAFQKLKEAKDKSFVNHNIENVRNPNDVVNNGDTFEVRKACKNCNSVEKNDHLNLDFNQNVKPHRKSKENSKGFEEVKSVIIDQSLLTPGLVDGDVMKNVKREMLAKRSKDNDVLRDYSNDNLYSYKHSQFGDYEENDEEKSKSKAQKAKKAKRNQQTYMKNFGIVSNYNHKLRRRQNGHKRCDDEHNLTGDEELFEANVHKRNVDNKYMDKILEYSKIFKLSKENAAIGSNSTANDDDDDSTRDSKLGTNFPKRKLTQIGQTYDGEETYDDYDDNPSTMKAVDTTVRKKTQAAEGDYADEEDPYSNKEQTKKFNKVKKTENEFANPPTATTNNDYYDEETMKTTTPEHVSAKEKHCKLTGESNAQLVKKLVHNEGYVGEELESRKRELSDEDLIGFTHHGRKKTKDQKHVRNKVKYKGIEPEIKQNKQKFYKNLLNNHQKNDGLMENDDEEQPIVNVNTEKNYNDEGNDEEVEDDEKRARKDVNFRNLVNSLFHSGGESSTRNEKIQSLSTETVDQLGENKKFGGKVLMRNDLKNKRSDEVSSVCGTSTTECVNDIVPVTTTTMKTTTVTKTMHREMERKENGRVDALITGKLPMKIVDNMYCKLKKNEKLSRRFKSGLNRNRNYVQGETFGSCETNNKIDTSRLMNSIYDLINDFLEDTTTCMQLTPALQNYLHKILNAKKLDLSGNIAENEREMNEMDTHQNNMLFKQKDKVVNAGTSVVEGALENCDYKTINEKMKALNTLLEKYNHMSERCQSHAKLVKDYIVDHLKMLSKILSGHPTHHCDESCESGTERPHAEECSSSALVEQQLESVGLGKKHDFQPNFDLNALVEREKQLTHGVAAGAATMASINVKKRKVSSSVTQSIKYKQLLDAVNELRRRRESEGKIGIMFGKARRSDQAGDDADDKDLSKISNANFESPLVYSL